MGKSPKEFIKRAGAEADQDASRVRLGPIAKDLAGGSPTGRELDVAIEALINEKQQFDLENKRLNIELSEAQKNLKIASDQSEILSEGFKSVSANFLKTHELLTLLRLMIGVLAARKGDEQSKVIDALDVRLDKVQAQMVVTSPELDEQKFSEHALKMRDEAVALRDQKTPTAPNLVEKAEKQASR